MGWGGVSFSKDFLCTVNKIVPIACAIHSLLYSKRCLITFTVLHLSKSNIAVYKIFENTVSIVSA